MLTRRLTCLLVALTSLAGCRAASPPESPAGTTSAGVTAAARPALAPVALRAELETSFARWTGEGPTGDAAHKEQLRELASALQKRLQQTEQVDVVFVCTHNSRRSHMAQLLGLAAARRAGLAKVRTFSGGTEATAFNPRAVNALRRAGFDVSEPGDPGAKNPRYQVRFADGAEPVEAFSKKFTDAPNPASGFIVVMTCSQADAACPFVPGAVTRLAVPYDDPKVADGTPEETARYDERVAQIGRDLAWVFATAAGR